MSAFPSKVVRNLFGTEEMRSVFSDETRIRNDVKIEVALAEVKAALGLLAQQA